MKIKDMPVYQDSIVLARLIRSMYGFLKKEDQYSVGQQMLRSSVSIASNIAEGVGRESTDKNLLLFLGHARGSLYELMAQIEIIETDYVNDPLLDSVKPYLTKVEIGLKKFSSFIREGKK